MVFFPYPSLFFLSIAKAMQACAQAGSNTHRVFALLTKKKISVFFHVNYFLMTFDHFFQLLQDPVHLHLGIGLSDTEYLTDLGKRCLLKKTKFDKL